MPAATNIARARISAQMEPRPHGRRCPKACSRGSI